MEKIFKMPKKIWLENIFLILLALAIAFSPSFSAGKITEKRVIELRIEDFLLTIFCAIFLFEIFLSKKRLQKPPLFLPISLLIGAGFLSSFANLILGKIKFLPTFFYFLKEIQFFVLYFYVFYKVKNFNSAKILINCWICFSLLWGLWILFELLSGIKLAYYYGPTLLIENDNPFGSGTFFLFTLSFLLFFLIFKLSLSNFKTYQIILTSVFSSILSLGLFASGSLTAFWSLSLTLLFASCLFIFKNGLKNSITISAPVLAILLTFFILLILNFPFAKNEINLKLVYSEINPDIKSSRINIWKKGLSKFASVKQPFKENPKTAQPQRQKPLWEFLIGSGKSSLVEAHNLYLKFLVETGIFGLLSFLFLIFSIFKKSFKNFLSKDSFVSAISGASLVLLFSALLTAFFADSFLWAVKISEVFWFFVAVSMASFKLKEGT
jgi:hypothetical protein